MKKEYYISRMRMNARIADTVIDGKHIRIGNETYELVSKAPIGRHPVQRLLNESTNTRITIYS